MNAPGLTSLGLTVILGEINDSIQDCHARDKPTGSRIRTFQLLYQNLHNGLERFHEQVGPKFESMPHVHLAFLYVKLFLSREFTQHFGTPAGHGFEIDNPIDHALVLLDNLCRNQLPLSPFTQHFSTLCRITLLEHSHRTYYGDPVPKGLSKLRAWYSMEENPLAGAPGAIGEQLNVAGERSIKQALASIEEKTSRRGLQHLADAAVGNAGTEEQAAEDEGAKAS